MSKPSRILATAVLAYAHTLAPLIAVAQAGESTQVDTQLGESPPANLEGIDVRDDPERQGPGRSLAGDTPNAPLAQEIHPSSFGPIAALPDSPMIPGALRLGDPTLTGAIPGVLPELALPTLDVLAATLSISPSGAAISATGSPFALMSRWVPIVSDTQIVLRADSSRATWGVGLSTGFSSPRMHLGYVDDGGCEQQYRHRRDEIAAAAGAGPQAPGDTLATWSATISGAIDEVRNAEDRAVLRGRLVAAAAALGSCGAQGYRSWLARHAYDGGFVVLGSLAADFTALVDEPVSPEEDETRHFVSSWSTSLRVGFFPDALFAVWLGGTFAERRPNPSTNDFGDRAGVTATVVGVIPIGDPTAERFQPGVGVGVAGSFWACLEQVPCLDEFKPTYSDSVHVSNQLNLTPFIDLRFEAKLQLRISVAIDRFHIADGGLWRITPSLSLSTSQWWF